MNTIASFEDLFDVSVIPLKKGI